MPESPQAVPLDEFVFTQPTIGLHESFVHWFISSQFGAGPPTHEPPLHVSLVVHALPSLHGLLLFACKHPRDVSHVSVVHTLPSLQFGAAPPTHDPPEHISFVVHAFPSLHALELLLFTQPVMLLHESVVHTLPSLQFGGAPPTQEPPEHVSLVVHAFPSVQELVLLAY